MTNSMRNPNAEENSNGSAIRAAQYVRMSTDHQKYSTDNQKDTISQFAEKHNMVIPHQKSLRLSSWLKTRIYQLNKRWIG